MTKYVTYEEIPKSKKGTTNVPLNAAGKPYKLYEHDPAGFPEYFGLSDRLIMKIQNPSAKIKKIQAEIQKGAYVPSSSKKTPAKKKKTTKKKKKTTKKKKKCAVPGAVVHVKSYTRKCPTKKKTKNNS